MEKSIKNIYIFVCAVCRFVFVVVVIVVWFLAHVIFVDALCVDVIFVVAIFVEKKIDEEMQSASRAGHLEIM